VTGMELSAPARSENRPSGSDRAGVVMRLNRWVLRRWAKAMLTSVSSHREYVGNRRVVVLCYHSVNPLGWPGSITPELFDAHLGWLKANCDVVRFSEIAQWVGRADGVRPTVAITFDDGYADNHEYALPLLTKWQLPATFFVTAGLVEKDPLVLDRFRAYHALGRDAVRPIAWAHLSEMLRAGMEIGAHTYSHANLARSDRAFLRREIVLSKEIIEERLGVPVTSMAYPFGLRRAHFNQHVVDAVEAAGYSSAAAVLYRDVRPIDLPYSIPRFFPKRDDLDILRLKILGGFDVISLWQRWAPLSLGRLLSPDYFGSGARRILEGSTLGGA
jgi:peptidoglycan/xylan/chitin deacetylase (PgdA/CDA1 family)